MDDVIFVAIVNAWQYLLHKHGGIFLTELSSGNDLVEQLTTLADVSDDVVSLLILEELVHLQDVWMVQIFQIVDLIEEHLLLILIHVWLTEDLDSSLSATFSMYADSNFTKGSWSEHLSNPVMVS